MQRSASQGGKGGSRLSASAIGGRRGGRPFVEPVGPAGDAHEREADRIAEAVVRDAYLRGGGIGWAAAAGGSDETIQRKCIECAEEEEEQIRRAPRDSGTLAEAAPDGAASTDATAPASLTAAQEVTADFAARDSAPGLEPARSGVEAEEASPTGSGRSLLVENDADAEGGQMRKGAFLAALRVEVCAAVDEALSGTGRDSEGCPWIDHWLGYYEGRSARQVEQSLRRYAPEAGAARTAQDYIPFVVARVRRSAEHWAKTGEIAGVPEELPSSPMAGGGLLAGFGGMFFKARTGGARRAEPVQVRRQLGSGESMPGGLRARMESAFGASFGHVRLHTDANAARLSDDLRARAFTIGRDVAFAGGEYRPGTIEGDAIIAHELAHVVQQGETVRSPGVREPLPPETRSPGAFEEDADAATTGVLARLHAPGSSRVAGTHFQPIPRLRTGLQLHRCASAPRKVEGAKLDGKPAKLTLRKERDTAISDANERLRAVDAWASTQVKAQNVPSLSGVVNLDHSQAENVAAAIKSLERAQSLFGTKQLDALPAKLEEVQKHAKEAKNPTGPTEEDRALSGRHALNLAISAADEASTLVTDLGRLYDVAKVSDHVDEIVKALNAAQAGKMDIFDAVEIVKERVKAAKKEIRELHERFDKTPKAIERILFVLKSFLALNAPDLTSPPTSDEIKRYMANLGTGLGSDFEVVFGEGLSTAGFTVFVAYADVLAHQLKIREQMAKEGVNAQSPIPTQGDAEALFKALKTKDNNEVFEAYQTYAQAYFYHRVIDQFGDLNVTDVAELYKRPLSIFGTRPLVCTGYALLGAHLLQLAGATLTHFIVIVHATEADLTTSTINDAHAVALMKRKGRVFYVTNHLIAFTKADAYDVAWSKPVPPAREIEAPGGSILGATDAVMRAIEKTARALKKPAGK